MAYAGDAQSGLVDPLQGQAWLDGRPALACPGADQVPGAQTQMLGRQQPQADHGAADLVGQQLTHAPFDAGRVGRLGPLLPLRALGLDDGALGPKPIEFFFAGHTPG